MKLIYTLALLLITQFTFGQTKLLSTEAITKEESKVKHAFERYLKKPKNGKRTRILAELYNESVRKHTDRLEVLSKTPSDGLTDWEGIVNEITALKYLRDMTHGFTISGLNTSSENLTAKEDSLRKKGSRVLYKRSKKILEKDGQAYYTYADAFTLLNRSVALDSTFDDGKNLLKKVIAEGKKTVSFAPVGFDNQGNYIEWSTDHASVSSDYIIGKLIHDLSIQNIGAELLDHPAPAREDWTVEMQWVALNISPAREVQRRYEREKTEKTGDNEKKIKATVVYRDTHHNISGTLSVTFKDARSEETLVSKTFTGTSFLTNTTATFSGDRNALTYQDMQAIEKSYQTYKFTSPELVKRMYTEQIHPQILRTLGHYLNWNIDLGSLETSLP
ncbi:hypothetical protein FUAX_48480 (plasmid) [Fulvitalea axinellae]|uniref:Uncharacterized protein n=1 Tax=Fulvitalea axinellae TaxID=1182444 RepID=A0AAU9DH26_9BACT|nr:hypothetical protein FUAX_48480 [Fulvitalea axinellae]